MPSTLRQRWGTHVLGFEDKGDHAEIWPLPEDPIAAARGALKGRVGPTEDLRGTARKDEARAAARRR